MGTSPSSPRSSRFHRARIRLLPEQLGPRHRRAAPRFRPVARHRSLRDAPGRRRDANTIGTTYLRAQTLGEPVRTRSLDLLRGYTDAAIRISHEVPQSAGFRRTVAAQGVLQRRLWGLAGQALDDAPVASAPRLYVDSLNAMIDQQTVRVAALNNRVPNTVLWLEVIASAVALGTLALYRSLLGRGTVAMLAAAVIVAMLLYVTFDLDRPTRGLVTVPDTPLTSLRASMALPPAAE